MLLDDSSQPPHQSSRHFFDRIEGRHKYKEGNLFMGCQKGGSPWADRSTHHKDILLCPAHLTLEELVKIETILFDGIRDKCAREGGVLSVRRVLNCIEGNVSLCNDWLEEVADWSNVFCIAMEVNEALFGFPALIRGDFEEGNFPSFLHFGIGYTIERSEVPYQSFIEVDALVRGVLWLGGREYDTIALAAEAVAEDAGETLNEKGHLQSVIIV